MMPLPFARIALGECRARASMPPAFGVSTSSAPNARIDCRRSSDRLSGITSTIR